MANRIKSFLANEAGATAIEYALIASLIALVLLSADMLLAGKLNAVFNEVSSNLQ